MMSRWFFLAKSNFLPREIEYLCPCYRHYAVNGNGSDTVEVPYYSRITQSFDRQPPLRLIFRFTDQSNIVLLNCWQALCLHLAPYKLLPLRQKEKPSNFRTTWCQNFCKFETNTHLQHLIPVLTLIVIKISKFRKANSVPSIYRK